MAAAVVKTVMVSKVPGKLAGLFKQAIKQGAITFVGEHAVTVAFDELQGPLKEFFNNVPDIAKEISHIAEEGYHSVKILAEEAWNECLNGVKNVGESIGHKVEVVAKEIADGVEDAGETVIHVFKDAGESVRDAAEDVGKKILDWFKPKL